MFFSMAGRRLIPELPDWVLRRLPHINPQPRSMQDRLADLPLDGLPLDSPVEVRWNERKVPWITAESDRDLAFSLGLVHAHLRTSQIVFLHKLATGRLCELFGPLALDVDHAMRIASLGHAARDIVAAMPEDTRQWSTAYVDGINHYWQTNRKRPPELALFRQDPEPWTVEEMITVGRLIGADFYWLTFFGLLAERGKKGFKELWQRVRKAGETAVSPFANEPSAELLFETMAAANRAGSNSVAVSGERTESGSAMIANDPHLGLSLPNFFVICGAKSPTYNAVGLMVPGLPMHCVGRNPDMAWGGTNLRAASSDLYDVTDMPADTITSETVTFKPRFWRKTRRTVRRSPFGPILSDAKLCVADKSRALALRWVGHEVTDEITSFLKASRSTTPQEFRDAFETYGVTALNIVFADKNGNIGELIAATQPIRNRFPEDDFVLDATDPETHWCGFAHSTDLPAVTNPPSGIVVSANHRPTESNILIGYLFGVDSRKRRIEAMLLALDKVSIDDLIDLQTDTAAPEAGQLASTVAARLRSELGTAEANAIADRLDAWQGNYDAASRDALLFEVLLCHLCHDIFDARGKAALGDQLGQWSYISSFLVADLDALAAEERRDVLAHAVARTLEDCAKFDSWGDMHRLKLAHFLHNLPVIGKAFVFDDLPVGGSRQTPMKTAHGLVREKHGTTLGSMARHISDMGDPDANWFVILGGQDGWLHAENFRDQTEMWRRRDYVRMPLTREAVEREFPIITSLKPAGHA